MAEAANVRLTLRHDGPATPWRADRATLFTLLKNLLENAIQHAPAGSEVSVTVGADALTVRDAGPGVEPEQVARMFERFWRGAHRRDHGAGLGLAICQEIARAHGWTLAAQRMEPGLLFRLATRPTLSA
jgi:signal transduction histidine kinase